MNDQEIRDILKKYKKVAVVGLSPNPDRPSYEIAEFLLDQGYDVVGVNPGQDKILECPIYHSVDQVPGSLEIVDVFRSSQYIPELVDKLIPLKPKVLWLQLGITHPEAEQKARKAGIQVISDRCILVEHNRLLGVRS